MRLPRDPRHLLDGGDGGAETAGAEPAELRPVVAVLSEARPPVPAVVVDDDGPARGDEVPGERRVPPSVLPTPWAICTTPWGCTALQVS